MRCRSDIVVKFRLELADGDVCLALYSNQHTTNRTYIIRRLIPRARACSSDAGILGTESGNSSRGFNFAFHCNTRASRQLIKRIWLHVFRSAFMHIRYGLNISSPHTDSNIGSGDWHFIPTCNTLKQLIKSAYCTWFSDRVHA